MAKRCAWCGWKTTLSGWPCPKCRRMPTEDRSTSQSLRRRWTDQLSESEVPPFLRESKVSRVRESKLGDTERDRRREELRAMQAPTWDVWDWGLAVGVVVVLSGWVWAWAGL